MARATSFNDYDLLLSATSGGIYLYKADNVYCANYYQDGGTLYANNGLDDADIVWHGYVAVTGGTLRKMNYGTFEVTGDVYFGGSATIVVYINTDCGNAGAVGWLGKIQIDGNMTVTGNVTIESNTNGPKNGTGGFFLTCASWTNGTTSSLNYGVDAGGTWMLNQNNTSALAFQ